MHADIQPFWPFSEAIPLRWVWPMNFRNLWCSLLGLWCFLRLLTLRWDAMRRNASEVSHQATGVRLITERLAHKALGAVIAAVDLFCVRKRNRPIQTLIDSIQEAT